MPDPVSATIATALAKGVSELVVKAFGSLAIRIGGNTKTLIEDRNLDLAAHLRASYERCTKVKTLLNRAVPVDLTSIYVNTIFKSEMKQVVTDQLLTSSLDRIKRVVITGTGGGGKTMSMKYLWLSIFTGDSGRVPVFIELRRLNEITTDNILTYIYKSIMGTSAILSEKVFAEASRKGAFVFLLDGFDEVANERKDSVEKQILNFCYENPEAIVVVSGRPDPRFDSWQNFNVLQVAPMTKTQVMELIDKFDYDRTTKHNFSRRVKSDLYDRHTTFLSNPLLATMMMLTFDQFADIPEKIYVFYEQAFDTLFSKHDATKEGFKRQHRTGLPVDTFKQCLSYFCLFTYFQERFEFTSAELNDYLNRLFKAVPIQLDTNDFITDLREAVCLIQEEGYTYSFTHRSFQEYFCALCLSNFISANFADILQRIALRNNDTVVRMIFEMNQSKLERQFLLPKMKEMIAENRNMKLKKDFAKSGKYFGVTAAIGTENAGTTRVNRRFMQLGGNDRYGFVHLLRWLYPDEMWPSEKQNKAFNEKDNILIATLSEDPRYHDEEGVSNLLFSSQTAESDEATKSGWRLIPLEIISTSGFADYLAFIWLSLERLTKTVDQRLKNTQKTIDEILQI